MCWKRKICRRNTWCTILTSSNMGTLTHICCLIAVYVYAVWSCYSSHMSYTHLKCILIQNSLTTDCLQMTVFASDNVFQMVHFAWIHYHPRDFAIEITCFIVWCTYQIFLCSLGSLYSCYMDFWPSVGAMFIKLRECS